MSNSSNEGGGIDSIIKALDTARMSRFQAIITLLSALGVFLDGYDISIISVALLYIKPEFHPTSYELGLIGAATSIGMLIGALLFGYLADRFGRRLMFIWDLIFFVIFTALTAMAQNTIQLIIFRALLGIGLGADYALSTTIVAEFSPKSWRGKLMAANVFGWWVGALAAYLIGLALLPLGPISWRYMLAIGIIPAIAVIISRNWLPESPRWLVVHGQAEKAAKILEKALGVPVKPSDVEAAYKPLPRVPISELFSRDIVRYTAFVWGFWFAFDFVFYGISIFTPTLLIALGLKGMTAAVQASVFVAAMEMAGSAVSIVLMDRLGRKPITAIGFLVASALLLALGLMYPPSTLMLLTLFPLYAFFLTFGPGTTDFVYSAELFPTRVRATGQASSTAISRVGAVISIFFFPTLLATWGTSLSLIFFAIVGS
ncbi:MFS transporter [Vulcanisaeta sp. JCM 14467]|uniref:MFS transporter n=1 Tax=Vulcanisaeta sp. JCM 14467 TaxID=1295370 RepID=UPI0006CFF025|nr:MFS transporter [Vulcanisaeta sp. JCM 14467]